MVGVPGAPWLSPVSQFIPQCPVLGWAGDPGSQVLDPRIRTGREVSRRCFEKNYLKHK